MSADKSAMVTRLLSRNGSKTNVKILRNTGGTTDQLTGKTTGGTDEILPTLSFVSKVPDSLIDGTRIRMGDRQVLLDNSVDIIKSDIIQIAGKSFSIIVRDGYNHAGVQQFWKLICRG